MGHTVVQKNLFAKRVVYREYIERVCVVKDVYILGIESSCDETAAAVVKNGREVLSNVISSQIVIHRRFGCGTGCKYRRRLCGV